MDRDQPFYYSSFALFPSSTSYYYLIFIIEAFYYSQCFTKQLSLGLFYNWVHYSSKYALNFIWTYSHWCWWSWILHSIACCKRILGFWCCLCRNKYRIQRKRWRLSLWVVEPTWIRCCPRRRYFCSSLSFRESHLCCAALR